MTQIGRWVKGDRDKVASGGVGQTTGQRAGSGGVETAKTTISTRKRGTRLVLK